MDIFLARRHWLVNFRNVLNGIEVWLKLCKKQDLTSEDLKTFQNLIHPNMITKSGRKVMASLESDQTYTLQDLVDNCGLKANSETPWQNVFEISEQETAYIMFEEEARRE